LIAGYGSQISASARWRLAARQELVTTSTGQINRLRALLLTDADRDRAAARAAFTDTALSSLARRRLPVDADRLHAVRHGEIRRLAISIRDTAKLLKHNRHELHELVDQLAPGLTDRPGIGPVSAAQVVVSFSHIGRVRSDAAFAALAGTSPIPASSGQTVRHRLNRGGDRALNRAVHTIAQTRMRSCERTRRYIDRRTAEGKTSREIRRAIKRYITRELYRTLTATMAT
jgi:transposase